MQQPPDPYPQFQQSPQQPPNYTQPQSYQQQPAFTLQVQGVGTGAPVAIWSITD
jgi:hypothetical protein